MAELTEQMTHLEVTDEAPAQPEAEAVAAKKKKKNKKKTDPSAGTDATIEAAKECDTARPSVEVRGRGVDTKRGLIRRGSKAIELELMSWRS